MKKVLIFACAFLFVATVAFAAGPKTYQVTGPVLEVTTDTVVVQKGKDKWEVGRDAATKVSGDQISNALGADKVQDIAGKLGVSGNQVSDGLASLLPQIIDKLTPHGQVPEGNVLDRGISALADKFLKG
jgi:hypothetical protein